MRPGLDEPVAQRRSHSGGLLPGATPRRLALVALASLLAGTGVQAGGAAAAGHDPALFTGLHWRLIGPFRGGRTVAATGVRGRPNLFYMGVNDGGVWRTTDAGRTWTPIFDDQPTGSIGAIAVAPSDPRVLYVGSGEGLQRPDLSVGDGIYRSADEGRTWRHLGLRDAQQIPSLIVDPADPNRLFAAALGHPYGPNRERGVFRSSDGGDTWQAVLAPDENTGAVQVLFDPASAQTVYAVLWAARQAPWEVGESFTLPANNGLFKSSDGGTTWRRVGAGLPGAAEGLGRIGIAAAASEPRRLYAVLGAVHGGGLYRSDDAGENWQLVNDDRRLWERDGDFNEVQVDPRNPDHIVVANVVCWVSRDGGRTFTAWRGAPGGDDYHRVWFDPDDPRVAILAGDQGAVVTVNDGATWSSWYNQPTAQLYHVATDDAFPYRVYGGQQESGSVGISSRGDDGQITLREWHPVGIEEYGAIAPDPLHPDLVFGGKVERWDWRTRDVQNVTPDPLRNRGWRWVRTMPIVFSPADPRTLWLGANVVFSTRDGGGTWQVRSPDLTRTSYETPPNLGAFASRDGEQGRHRGVVYALAPSPRRAGLVWAGTDDGRIHVTHDGGARWSDVTPPSLVAWSKVSVIEASRFDTLEAWAAINGLRLDDLRPHLLRTRDGGRTWSETVQGIPASEVVNAVREDPKVRGLLYAATERGVHVSFDDGEHWQSLRLDLPSTSVRDLTVHGTDLVIATHGRSFWILDDVSPLRQAAAAAAASGPFLLEPALATRVRGNRNTDTPVPPDEPAAPNPPDGAVIDYVLPQAARGPLTLEITDASGRLVRRFSSADAAPAPAAGLNIPEWWIRPAAPPGAAAGAHRFVWDLREADPPVGSFGYPIAAIAHDTPREPRGPWVLPGRYTVRLTADGAHQERPLVVRMDPRVRTAARDLVRQHALALRLVGALRRDSLALASARTLQARRQHRATEPGGAAPPADSLDRALERLIGSGGGRFGRPAADTGESLARLASELAGLYALVEDSDAPPTPTAEALVHELEQALGDLERRTRALLTAAL